MYENTKKPLLSTRQFIIRTVANFSFGLLIILISLGIGMIGYKYYEGLSWVDAYENAAMILSGMGPVTELKHSSAKIFAGTYALFSGVIFLVVIAIIFAPIVHRFLHQLHIKEK